MKFEYLVLVLSVAKVCNAQTHWVNAQTPIEDKVIVIPEDYNTKTQDPGPDYRLPTSIIPQHYFLRIRPIIDRDHAGVGEKNTAPASVKITVRCVQPVTRIVMHQKFLTINESSIQVKSVSSQTQVPVQRVERDVDRDFFIIVLSTLLSANSDYEISIDYVANVPPNDSLRGLYSEEYFDPETNQTRVMAATQMEPLRARQVLPCFDEPTYKATFDVVIGRTVNFTSLANSPQLITEPDTQHSGWFWDTFVRTVKMPTYLLALAVSQYAYSEASNDLYRLPVRVYGPQHLVHEGRALLTANASAMIMKYFETKYVVPHNMPKVDSISVPYKGGAMENYGLITYGEYLLMHYEGTSLSSELRQIYNILAHELGHQWFGNLVTCKWWSDIWLNEGFATYVSYEGMHALWPEFDMMTYMVSATVNSALTYDAGPSSHPIHQEAYTASQIGSNMDTIGYDKGGSVIRMMVSFLGENTFYNGIRQYLTKMHDSVAEQDDLFLQLDAAVNQSGLNLPKSVAEIMHTWTLQKGFPLVRVNLSGTNELLLSQEPWENANVRNESNRPNSSWHIPVNYLVPTTQGSGQVWLLQNEGPSRVTLQNGGGWVLINSDAGGYYRTLYDEQLTARILQQLQTNHSVFPAPARVRLLNDYFTLAFEKYIPIETALEFTKYLANETDSTVWRDVISKLSTLLNLYRIDLIEDWGALGAYLSPRVVSVLTKLSENTNPTDVRKESAATILESQLLDLSCKFRSDYCYNYYDDLFTRWEGTPDDNIIPNDFRSIMYCKYATEAGLLEFLTLNELYNNATVVKQKSRIGAAFGCVVYTDMQKTVIDMILNPEPGWEMSKIDSIPALQQMLRSPAGNRDYLLNIISESTEAFLEYYDGNVNSLVQILSPLTQILGTEADVVMLEKFIAENDDVFKGSLNSTLSAVRQNVEWMNEYRTPITKWLNNNV